jgi:hypothetical protein
MVSLIGLQQRAGTWKIVMQAEPVVGFDWEAIRSQCRDVTGPTLYQDLAAVFERDELKKLATEDHVRDWIENAPGADIFLIVLGESVESGLGD